MHVDVALLRLLVLTSSHAWMRELAPLELANEVSAPPTWTIPQIYKTKTIRFLRFIRLMYFFEYRSTCEC